MGHERRAGARAVAGDDVDHTRRQTDRLEVLGQLEDGERRLLRRLEHHGAPRRERGRDLPGGHHQRIVPRYDLPGHTHRLPHGHGDRVGGDGQHLAVDLGGKPAVVLETGGGIVHVVLGLDDRLPGVDRLQLRQLRPAGADPLGQPEQDPAALLRGNPSPAVVEGLCGRLAPPGPRPACRPARWRSTPSVDGVEDLERLPARRIHELAIYVHLVPGDLRFPGLARRPGRAGHLLLR